MSSPMKSGVESEKLAELSIHEILELDPTDPTISGHLFILSGWAKEFRMAGSGVLMFLHLGDGLSTKKLQVVYDVPPEFNQRISYEAAVEVQGHLVASPAKGQQVEIKATKISLLGECDPEIYPFPKGKKGHSMEHLRKFPHLRAKTRIFSAIMKIKHQLFMGTHFFHNQRDFCWIQTPIITSSDCEGAGEAFSVISKNEPQYWRDQHAYLTVSGQLHVEPFALALGKVYTLGPSFRAEKSQTSRHLAEFWMLEPEMAFYDLSKMLDLIESYFKYVIRSVLTRCADELEVCAQKFKRPDLIELLTKTEEQPFARVTYAEALTILQQAQTKNKKLKFEKPSEWGIDLGSDQEKYLAEVHFQRPVFVTNYPESIKAFYMYRDDLPEGQPESMRTVSCVDCLFPGIGEVVGGSQREHRLPILQEKIAQFGLDPKLYEWYTDTRRFGGAPHSGFGVGMDRLLRFLTGIENIMDAVPYPVRYELLTS